MSRRRRLRPRGGPSRRHPFVVATSLVTQVGSECWSARLLAGFQGRCRRLWRVHVRFSSAPASAANRVLENTSRSTTTKRVPSSCSQPRAVRIIMWFQRRRSQISAAPKIAPSTRPGATTHHSFGSPDNNVPTAANAMSAPATLPPNETLSIRKLAPSSLGSISDRLSVPHLVGVNGLARASEASAPHRASVSERRHACRPPLLRP
jgi:hypothetical protein